MESLDKLKNITKNTRIFNALKETEFYWKIKRKLPKRVPIYIYLTLECNLKCSYCVNQANSKESKINQYKILPGEKWIKAINRARRPIVFTGGEPTLHPDFIEIINNINKSIPILVYTNFLWEKKFLKKFLKQIKRPVKFLGSYHPSGGKPEIILEVIETLKQKNMFDGMLHSVGTKNQLEFLEKEVRPFFKKQGIFLTIDKDQFEYFDAEACSMKFRKKVKCSRKSITIAPDGKRYQCVSNMLRKKNPIRDFVEEGIKREKCSCICLNYGFCNPCDMGFKIKFLK